MIDGLEDALTDAASKGSEKVRGALLTAMPREHQHLFAEAESAKAGWDALVAIHEDRGITISRAALTKERSALGISLL